ncbi:MAG: DNRLRE domain-containing protein [Chloroflexi bacterium]|nr:DNRLRE domain-containing protein [Chloroflexota bacterium]MBU1748663.1 DNRLRE domain-containing protein [Chloroflexota bacterium]
MPIRSLSPFVLALVTCLLLVPLLAGAALAQGSHTVTIQLDASTGRSLGVMDIAPAGWGSDHSTSVLPFGNYLGPQSGELYQARTYLWFPLDAIPRNAHIEAATLELQVADWPFTGSGSMGVYRVTAAWDESITWGTRPTADGVPTASTVVNSTVGWYSWDVTGVVQGWFQETSVNYGLMLAAAPMPDTLIGNGWACAAPGRTSSDPGEAPRLVVTYTQAASTEVPEPATVVLVGAGLAGLAGLLAIRRRMA